jgi:excisionase family DNA binding protein
MSEQNKADRRHPIMNVQEVADYLKLSVTTVYRMAQQGRFPCIKIGRQWRFRQEDVYNLFVQDYIRKIKKVQEGR